MFTEEVYFEAKNVRNSSGWSGWGGSGGADYVSTNSGHAVVFRIPTRFTDTIHLTSLSVSIFYAQNSLGGSETQNQNSATCYLYTSDPTASSPESPPSAVTSAGATVRLCTSGNLNTEDRMTDFTLSSNGVVQDYVYLWFALNSYYNPYQPIIASSANVYGTHSGPTIIATYSGDYPSGGGGSSGGGSSGGDSGGSESGEGDTPKPVTYTITFDANGGSTTPAPLTLYGTEEGASTVIYETTSRDNEGSHEVTMTLYTRPSNGSVVYSYDDYAIVKQWMETGYTFYGWDVYTDSGELVSHVGINGVFYTVKGVLNYVAKATWFISAIYDQDKMGSVDLSHITTEAGGVSYPYKEDGESLYATIRTYFNKLCLKGGTPDDIYTSYRPCRYIYNGYWHTDENGVFGTIWESDNFSNHIDPNAEYIYPSFRIEWIEDEPASSVTPRVYTRDGYTQTGWAYTPTTSTVAYYLEQPITPQSESIIDLYAMWSDGRFVYICTNGEFRRYQVFICTNGLFKRYYPYICHNGMFVAAT